MNNTQTSSFGLYEATRILIPGFYFASLCTMLFYSFISQYVFFPVENGFGIILFFFLVLVSGLTMYAKETTKRRRAFVENQPSAFLQDTIRHFSTSNILDEAEARQLYFYILNNYISPAFHEKVFFFGTVYHIMIQIRRTSFWFALLSILCLAVQITSGSAFADQQGLISFGILVCIVYLLNVKYNKADRKMQENYQDQIFWLQMNPDIIKDLFNKLELSKKSHQL